MVILWITGGLGDIFLSWRCAYNFQSQNNIPVVLVWERKAYAGTYEQKQFSRFFDVSEEFPMVLNVPCWKSEYSRRFMGMNMNRFISAVDSNGKWSQDAFIRNIGELTVQYCAENIVMINASFKDIKFPNTTITDDMFRMISPSSRIADRMKNIVESTGFNSPIGVHIRRTDNKWCISDSPDYLFIDKMKEILSWNPDQKFFLCTDDVGLKNRLREMFKGNVIALDVRSRYEEGGLDDSVVEMFLLSQCSKIYGCKSGFSIVASNIGNVPHVLLKTDSQNV